MTLLELGAPLHRIGAIDSYRAMIAFLPSRGVGVVLMTNFGGGDPGMVRRVVAALVRTGALAKRMPRPAPQLAAAMQSLLAVQNQWDEAAYKAGGVETRAL